MRTSVYVDGFNLYYGALKGTDHKWLDIAELTKRLLQPHHKVTTIKYFTARVSATPGDPSKPQRQNAYIRALQTYRPEVQVFYGHFLSHEVSMPVAGKRPKPRFATVIKTEEKGSDVNLAVHMLHDAWQDLFDCAIVITNDSDISEAMRLVRTIKGKSIGLLTPGARGTSRQLQRHANFVKTIRKSAISKCQLPDPIPGHQIHKPQSW